MVSTRSHPQDFPEPTASPSKLSRSTPAPTSSSPPSQRSQHSETSAAWSHTPSNFTLIWLAVSLPLVVWDSAYIFLRPHSMAGGKLQWPLWMPYDLYATIDYIYGWPAYNAHNGFTAAQGALNVVETIGYSVYLWIVYSYGKPTPVEGRGAPPKSLVGRLAESRVLYGKLAGWAVLIVFGTAIMTVSKTVLYWLNEAFGGFQNIGHNDASTLFFLWVVPK
ncbi:hypothetical protein H2203_002054 [Taxawa tesnikishii (nom. ined.)]|nr:hypothetical protein H2203_002054 [Dothideales sp. JES 119]